MKKIIVCGGHMTPALAVMRLLKQNNWQIYYLGRKHALEGDAALSQEYLQLKKMGYNFANLTTGRLQRNFTRYTLLSLLKIPVGLIQAIYYLRKFQPNVILSFGGYVALPICFTAWILGIPIVTHEQTLVSGLANKIIALFARKICISWEITQNHFPLDKVVYTGNPLRPDIFQKRRFLNLPVDKPIIYITGGNLGAHYINILVEQVLDKLLDKYTVIHQCGNSAVYRDFSRLKQKSNSLPKTLQSRYYLTEYVEADLIGWVYHKADLVVARPGANTITEILALKKASILIPLPGSGGGEQEKNAQMLTQNNAAGTVKQHKFPNGDELLTKIDQVLKSKAQILTQMKKLNQSLVLDADKKIAQVIESLM